MVDPVAEPLDAYQTAAPDEPTWTVQGGDPLGGPLLRIWAHFARIMAGSIPPRGLEGIFEQILQAANHNLPDVEAERKALLLRSTATEEISWKMDDYRRGVVNAAIEQKVPAENSPAELEKIDLHDSRVHWAQRLNNMLGELDEMIRDLTHREFIDTVTWNSHINIAGVMEDLRGLSAAIEPRRLMKSR